jgi:anti-sigma regulatory factor (Ser/Thr protein kinase)/23S rRNA pseudoU1915 N3-methylase RlmH
MKRPSGTDIQRFILTHTEKHPSDIARFTSEQFGISRQAITKHIQRLLSEKLLTSTGGTKATIYTLGIIEDWKKTYQIAQGVREDVILDSDIIPALGNLPENLLSIWSTAFTEMYNNVLDHSAATEATVEIKKTAVDTQMTIHDNGIGVFKKIQQALGLPDERYAIVQLAKGKFSTDPSRHSGEGIFFTSRMFDSFDIVANGLSFRKTSQEGMAKLSGTTVWMKINNFSTKVPKDVYDLFTEDFKFTKTAVPVRLAQVGSTGLVSRSQAKRILEGIDRFKVVSLDFTGVDWIGQGFADEMFRVYQNAHPHVQLLVEGASPDVSAMIQRVKGAGPVTGPDKIA